MDNNLNMKVGIVIQARLGSTRLPNKVLKPVSKDGLSIIEEIIRRSKLVKNVDLIIVATSDNPRDDYLVDYLSKTSGVELHRGSENDVLSRYCTAAEIYSLDHIVRLTGDNPCIDPIIIQEAIHDHINKKADYTYTLGYPLGMNIEIVKAKSLIEARIEGISLADKEHVTYYIRNHPERFNLNFIQVDLPHEITNLRLTVDTESDYLMIRILFDYLIEESNTFGYKEIVRFFKEKPFIFEINKNIYQKQNHLDLQSEIDTAIEILESNELNRAANLLKLSGK